MLSDMTRFLAPTVPALVLAACGPLSYDGELANSPDTGLSGCTVSSCNDTVLSGVVAKIEGSEGQDLSIRFYTLTDNENGTVTYRDGARTATMNVVGIGQFEGTNSAFAFSPTLTYTGVSAGAFGSDEAVIGMIGFQTDASVIPTSGEATYYGDSTVTTYNSGSGAGDSTLIVDFGAGTADLYANLTDGDVLTSFNEVQSLNMQIDGYSFTGDEVVLLLDSSPVDITGANSQGAGAGIFNGVVDIYGNPVEYGAVAILSGDSDKVLLLSEGEVAY